MSRCYNGGEKHNFQPRFNIIEKDRDFELSEARCSAKELRNLLTLTETTYVKDVCLWCGKERY